MKYARAILVVLLLGGTASAQAQGLFDKLRDKVTESFEETVTDKAAEETREKTEEAWDKTFEGESESSESSGAETSEAPSEPAESAESTGVPGEGGAADYRTGTGAGGQTGADQQFDMSGLEALMGSMNKASDLPDAYAFDLTLDIRTRNGQEDWQEMKMLLSKQGDAFGMVHKDDRGNPTTTVIDSERDLMVMYRIEDGRQVGQALPNMMKAAGAFAGYGGYQADEELSDFRFGPTGNTRTVAKEKTKEYKGEDDENVVTFYLAEDLGVDWRDAFGGFLQQVAPQTYRESYGRMEGFMLESHSRSKTDPGDTSDWETVNIGRDEVTYRTDDWAFEGR